MKCGIMRAICLQTFFLIDLLSVEEAFRVSREHICPSSSQRLMRTNDFQLPGGIYT
jgi:hypothetical protein